MTESIAGTHACELELPLSAPRIRVTIGMGSAGQKTWNLHRPVTLFGSQRTAHIALRHRDICRAHCTIINTGAHVLLKDLHTNGGTWVDKERITLVVLEDGDTIHIGPTAIQVAIQTGVETADDSAFGLQFVEPTRMGLNIVLHDVEQARSYPIESAVTLIGRHEDAEIHLGDDGVSTKHALIFRFGAYACICDLGSRNGTWIGDDRQRVARLEHGDRIQIGPHTLMVDIPDIRRTTTRQIDDTVDGADQTSNGLHRWPNPMRRLREEPHGGAALALDPNSVKGGTDPAEPGALGALTSIAQGIAGLESEVADSWDRVNVEGPPAITQDDGANVRHRNVGDWEAELEARDAALRGQLLEITRCLESLGLRERQLALEATRIEARSVELDTREKALGEHEHELERRERAVAQRWARFASKGEHRGGGR